MLTADLTLTSHWRRRVPGVWLPPEPDRPTHRLLLLLARLPGLQRHDGTAENALC